MTDILQDKRSVPIFIHSTIDDMTDLSPNDFRVYMHLARRSGKSGAAWPSYQKIGDHCFKNVYKHPDSRRLHAIQSVNNLVKAGLLEKTSRQENGSPLTNLYALIDPVATPQGGSDATITTPSDATITTPSDATITTLVTVQSPKDTKDKGTPIEGTPIGRKAAAPPAPPPPVEAKKVKSEPKAKAPSHPNTQPILDAYIAACGYEKPPTKTQYQQESPYAKELAEAGYTPEEVAATYHRMKSEDYWADKTLSLRSISLQIAAMIQRAKGRNGNSPGRYNVNGRGTNLEDHLEDPRKSKVSTREQDEWLASQSKPPF